MAGGCPGIGVAGVAGGQGVRGCFCFWRRTSTVSSVPAFMRCGGT